MQNLLSGLNCSGSEERLADCDHDGVNIVTTGCLRAAVRCKKKGMEQCWMTKNGNNCWREELVNL